VQWRGYARTSWIPGSFFTSGGEDLLWEYEHESAIPSELCTIPRDWVPIGDSLAGDCVATTYRYITGRTLPINPWPSLRALMTAIRRDGFSLHKADISAPAVRRGAFSLEKFKILFCFSRSHCFAINLETLKVIEAGVERLDLESCPSFRKAYRVLPNLPNRSE
jgi:hypothetical protein